MARDKPRRKRSHQIHFCVNDAEFKMIKDRMQRCCYDNLGEYARRMMIDGGILVIDDSKELKDFTLAVNDMSDKLNRLIVKADKTNSITRDEYTSIKEMIEELWRLQRFLMLKRPY